MIPYSPFILFSIMRRFRVNRRMSVPNILLGITLGVISGYYIYKPPLEKYSQQKNNLPDSNTVEEKVTQLKKTGDIKA